MNANILYEKNKSFFTSSADYAKRKFLFSRRKNMVTLSVYGLLETIIIRGLI